LSDAGGNAWERFECVKNISNYIGFTTAPKLAVFPFPTRNSQGFTNPISRGISTKKKTSGKYNPFSH
jgi:hypothetical protein